MGHGQAVRPVIWAANERDLTLPRVPNQGNALVSDELSRVVDELSTEPDDMSSAEVIAAQAADDLNQPESGPSTAETADTASSPPAVPAEESDAEQVKVAKPASFRPMSLADKPAAKKEKQPVSDEPIQMDWYILKVQSNRERSIADALRRKVAIEGLDRYFGEIVVPTEKVTEFKGGKKKVVERKLYPGYIVVNMHINDDTWFAVRETSGIGDFTGAGGKPTPMLSHEVARIVQTEEEVASESPKLNINFKLGDRVKIKEGTFESFEGEVSAIDEQSGRINVMINIFGRSTPVELEYWQVEQM